MQKTYIPGYRRDWRRVETTHTRVGVNSHGWQISLRAAVRSLRPSFQSRISLLTTSSLILSELTSTLSYMQAITNALHAHAHIYTHDRTHTYTLFLIWPIKRCVWEKRKFAGGSVTYTNTLAHTPSRSSAGSSCDMHNLKQQETCIVSPCQTGTVLHGFIVLYFNNATSFHSNLILLLKTQSSLIVCSALCTNQKWFLRFPILYSLESKDCAISYWQPNCNILKKRERSSFILKRRA